MEILDTLGFLVGTSRVTRLIEDHPSRTHGLFEGTAALIGATSSCDLSLGGRARYHEEGELQFGIHRGQAHRNLEYMRLDDATVMLYVADRRPFIDLDLSTGACRSKHLCGDDCYEIATFVRSRSFIEERWRVRGPTTGYDAVTTLMRAG